MSACFQSLKNETNEDINNTSLSLAAIFHQFLNPHPLCAVILHSIFFISFCLRWKKTRIKYNGFRTLIDYVPSETTLSSAFPLHLHKHFWEKQHIDQIYLSIGINDSALVTQLVETAGLQYFHMYHNLWLHFILSFGRSRHLL